MDCRPLSKCARCCNEFVRVVSAFRRKAADERAEQTAQAQEETAVATAQAADGAQAQGETAVATARAAEAAAPAHASSPLVGAGFTHSAAATMHDASHGSTGSDAFDFSRLLASLPSGDRLEAKLDQAFAHAKEAF